MKLIVPACEEYSYLSRKKLRLRYEGQSVTDL
jgi:hypothetical protein